ncbi:MAG TPA: hypothetical protein VKU19_30820 [Bryobacteraceae bacterium]|nr:hypothetical protein [Bryobacteraceae bacterium]
MPPPAVKGAITYTVKKNAFGDTLPVIPKESRVSGGMLLFRVDIDVVVTRSGSPAKQANVAFKVTGTHSHARLLAPTDASGKAVLRLETRYTGKNTITPTAPEFAASTFDVDISEAWYEGKFEITAYNVCEEDDFSSDLVEAKNVGKHKKDFLFSGKGVAMEGTGLASDGKFIQLSNPKDLTWKSGFTEIKNSEDAVFEFVDAPQGAFGKLTADSSIAIDPTILPPKHRVNIIGPRALGERKGMDTGADIKGFHFDNFVGAGKDKMTAWESAGGNIHSAKVKYLGN